MRNRTDLLGVDLASKPLAALEEKALLPPEEHALLGRGAGVLLATTTGGNDRSDHHHFPIQRESPVAGVQGRVLQKGGHITL
jgi:hypothetical protein